LKLKAALPKENFAGTLVEQVSIFTGMDLVLTLALGLYLQKPRETLQRIREISAGILVNLASICTGTDHVSTLVPLL